MLPFFCLLYTSYDYMVAHTDVDAGTYALVNQHSTAYNVAPVINGFGGYIIDKDADPGLNKQETKDAIAYNQKFAALEADGDYNTCLLYTSVSLRQTRQES